MKGITMKIENDVKKFPYIESYKRTLGRNSTILRMIELRKSKIEKLKSEISDLNWELENIVYPTIDNFDELKKVKPTVFKKKMGNHTYWVGKVYWYKKKLKDPVKGTGFYTKDWIWFQIGNVEKLKDKSMDELRNICKKKFYDKLKK